MDFSRQHPNNALLVLVFSILVSGSAHGVTLEAFPKTLNRSGDNVTLQWKEIPSPSDMDWLGIYSPADSTDDHFIGYIFLSSCPTWKEGSGSVELRLINLRSPYEFRVFHWDKSQITNTTPVDSDHNPLPSTAHLLAKSESVTFRNLNDPAQLHLAFTSNEDEMRVMFVTKEEIKSYVRYGLKEGELDKVAKAESLTYKQSEMCDAPANTTLGWRDPGYIHDAVMQGLKSGKRYFYQPDLQDLGFGQIQLRKACDQVIERLISLVHPMLGQRTANSVENSHSGAALEKTGILLRNNRKCTVLTKTAQERQQIAGE